MKGNVRVLQWAKTATRWQYSTHNANAANDVTGSQSGCESLFLCLLIYLFIYLFFKIYLFWGNEGGSRRANSVRIWKFETHARIKQTKHTACARRSISEPQSRWRHFPRCPKASQVNSTFCPGALPAELKDFLLFFFLLLPYRVLCLLIPSDASRPPSNPIAGAKATEWSS